jgi:hypothetical protein
MLKLSMRDIFAMEFEDYMFNKVLQDKPVDPFDMHNLRRNIGLPPSDPVGKTYHYPQRSGTQTWFKLTDPGHADGIHGYNALMYHQEPSGRRIGPIKTTVTSDNLNRVINEGRFTEVPDSFVMPDQINDAIRGD